VALCFTFVLIEHILDVADFKSMFLNVFDVAARLIVPNNLPHRW
jgi:hypothetical protein